MSSQKLNRGLWFLRVFMMCASLVGVLLAIEHLNQKEISLDAFTGARADTMEAGITATVRREMPLPQPAGERKPIDKTNPNH